LARSARQTWQSEQKIQYRRRLSKKFMQIRIINISLIDSGDEQAEFFSPQKAQSKAA
jgi:hypothetical protein